MYAAALLDSMDGRMRRMTTRMERWGWTEVHSPWQGISGEKMKHFHCNCIVIHCFVLFDA